MLERYGTPPPPASQNVVTAAALPLPWPAPLPLPPTNQQPRTMVQLCSPPPANPQNNVESLLTVAVAALPLPVPASVVTSSSPWKVVVMMLERFGLPPAHTPTTPTCDDNTTGLKGPTWICRAAHSSMPTSRPSPPPPRGATDAAGTLRLATCTRTSRVSGHVHTMLEDQDAQQRQPQLSAVLAASDGL